ncbi:MAG: cyclase family protein [Solirubrobacterales bacterium]
MRVGRVVDLTQPLGEGTVAEHSGTHLDAPAHFDRQDAAPTGFPPRRSWRPASIRVARPSTRSTTRSRRPACGISSARSTSRSFRRGGRFSSPECCRWSTVRRPRPGTCVGSGP